MTPRDSYLRRFRKYGVDPRTLKWQSQKAAEQRYLEITTLTDFNGKSVLDVGCGFGDLVAFINSKTENFSYTGIDLINEFILAARKKYPGFSFVMGDYFSDPLEEKFDIVVANGSLNSNVPDNYAFRKKAIKTMFDHARQAVIFNMAGGFAPKETARGSNVFFADASKIGGVLQSLTSSVVLTDHPGPREFRV